MNEFTELDREIKRFNRLSKAFLPKFSWVDSVERVSRMINAPHIDDTPQLTERTKRTAEIIQLLCKNEKTIITWFDAKQIHSFLWRNLNPNRIPIGCFRRYDVFIGLKKMPRFEFLPLLIDRAFPASPIAEKDIVDWYRLFESIHPFADGNGRVGGVIVAAISYVNYGRYLAPHQ